MFDSVIFLLLLIARSKLVPDFALTIHFINLVITSLYTKSIPTQLFWWLLQLASAGLMVSLGIWACQWRELKVISFGGNRTSAAAANSADADEEAGIAMEDRGKGRDGQGAYSMIAMDSRRGAP